MDDLPPIVLDQGTGFVKVGYAGQSECSVQAGPGLCALADADIHIHRLKQISLSTPSQALSVALSCARKNAVSPLRTYRPTWAISLSATRQQSTAHCCKSHTLSSMVSLRTGKT